jgi:ceramide glucosyltransferase
MILEILFLSGLAVSLVLFGVAQSALSARRREAARSSTHGFAPPVSILKPLCGLDDELEENLESFFELDYPDYEILFSFAGADDPAFAVARRVADRHPSRPAIFIVDGREPGGNAKVNRLAAAARRARSRHLLLSDGNVRVRRDFLARAVAPFEDARVGLVSHLFRGTGARSLGARLECLHLNGTLRAGTAAIAELTGSPCVVGKSILISRAALDDIGGFAAVRGYLAEDFLLGTMVSSAGYRVVLSGDELDTTEVSKSVAAFFARHRRWAILRRRLGGPGYAAEILASPFFWFAGAAAASGGRPGALTAAAALLTARYALETAARAPDDPRSACDWLLLPVRDALIAGVFWAGLFGRSTRWRGRRIQVGPRTRIETAAPSPISVLAQSARRAAT